MVIRPGELYPPRGHPAAHEFDWLRGRTLSEFQLILITGGAGEFESQATGHVPLEGAALIFVFPGVWHRYRPAPNVGWTERWMSFNGEFLHRLFDSGFFGPRLAVSTPRDAERLAEEFDKMLDEVRCGSVQHPLVLMFRALRVISDAALHKIENALSIGALPQEATNCRPEDPVVRTALELIWTQKQPPLSVNDIARRLPVTRRTLDRRFVEATGHSVLEEINTCRLSRARRLLTDTDLPVKMVSHLAGFTSTERMRVAFVEREGMSPTRYRKHKQQALERQGQGARATAGTR